jgi:hypothetical protein
MFLFLFHKWSSHTPSSYPSPATTPPVSSSKEQVNRNAITPSSNKFFPSGVFSGAATAANSPVKDSGFRYCLNGVDYAGGGTGAGWSFANSVGCPLPNTQPSSAATRMPQGFNLPIVPVSGPHKRPAVLDLSGMRTTGLADQRKVGRSQTFSEGGRSVWPPQSQQQSLTRRQSQQERPVGGQSPVSNQSLASRHGEQENPVSKYSSRQTLTSCDSYTESSQSGGKLQTFGNQDSLRPAVSPSISLRHGNQPTKPLRQELPTIVDMEPLDSV